MRYTLSTACCAAVLTTLPAFGQDMTLYRPAGEQFSDWSCSADALGQEGGSLGLAPDGLIGIGTQCTLKKPVPVRRMNATLYDAQCTGEGTEYEERVMVMQSPSGVYLIRDGFVFEWTMCPAS